MFVCFYFGTQETPTQTIQTLETLETDTPSLNKNINHCILVHRHNQLVLWQVLFCPNRGAFCVIIWKYEFRLTIRLFKGQEVCHLFEFSRPAELVCKPAEKKTNMKKPDACIFPWLHALIQHLTWEVDFCEGISGCGPCCCQQVDWLVIDMVAVAKVQPGEQRHLSTYEA